MNKNILITGVSRGLGLEIARAILRANWTVYGVSRTESEVFLSLRSQYPDRLHFIPCDLAGGELMLREVFRTKIPSTVELHGIVNNAAFAYDDLITNLDADKLKRMFDVNVYSPMLLTKYIIRRMLLHKTSGSLVNISSISVHTGYKGLAMYAASKAALEAFSRNTAREWGPRGIRSNCVVAGFMETAMSGALSAEQKRRIYERTALKKATSLESVANMVVFLLSDGSSSITGQNFHVDSGTI